MTRGRKGNEEKIKKFLAKALKNKNYDIYNSSGKPSPSKLMEVLTKETGIKITRQTMAKYLTADLTQFTVDIDFSGNAKIVEIKEAMEVAKDLYTGVDVKASDKTKALNSWKQLNQQLIDYEKHLRELQMRKLEAGKPNYLIKIDTISAEQKCPKCKNKFYVKLDEKKVEIDEETTQ